MRLPVYMWSNFRLLIKVLFLFAGFACSEIGNRSLESIPEPVNDPSKGVVYKPSELALSMRTMYENMQQLGKLLRQKQELNDSLFVDFSHILTDKPTNPAEIGPKFQAFANGWLGRYEEFAGTRDLSHYNDVMNACVTCHKQFCPGPISKIEKLKLFP